MKVLMIDDDPDVIEAVSLALQVRLPEAVFRHAVFGERGIEMVRTETPDMVILDVGLPDLNGFEVLKRIRAFSKVPVLMLTVWGDQPAIEKGLQTGADDYIVKPFSQAQLLARIKTLATGQDGDHA